MKKQQLPFRYLQGLQDSVRRSAHRGHDLQGVQQIHADPGHSCGRGQVLSECGYHARHDRDRSGASGRQEHRWHAVVRRWAMEYEISDGTNMTGAITREQLVAMLFRYAVKNGLEAVTLSENLTQFKDASDISAWAVSAMQWAVGQGLIQGSNGQLRPQANASRAEVATILMRFCELMKK